MNLRIGSLCSGYGSLDWAVQLVLGGDVAWHAEIDPAASAVLARHHASAPNHGDISRMDWSRAQPVDVLTAGWPCQPWSFAGRRKGIADDRAIWPAVARAVRDLRPRVVALENVPAVITLGELERAVGDLAACGYDATWCCVRASDVGSAHRRERVFVIAADPGREPVGQQPVAQPRRGGAPLAGLDHAPAADPDVVEGGPPCPTLAVPGEGWDGLRPAEPGRRGGAAADPTGNGRGQGRPAPTRQFGRPDAALGGHAAPNADSTGRLRARISGPDLRGADRPSAGRDDLQHDWGHYTPAIDRWERILRRPAPAPTVVGQRGARQLSHWLVEWLMGLPEGYVCDTPGLSRNDCLRLLGNGVVVQQGAAAIRHLVGLRRAAGGVMTGSPGREPAELVVRPPLSPDAAQHPLAHYDGLTCLLQALPAYLAWGDCTPRMRDTLRALWADLDQQARAATHGTPLVLPALPAGTHPRTAAALTRRGLAHDGYLTPLGGLAVYWCARPDTHRRGDQT